MEPITHLMTGACLARAGFNRKAAYATVTMVLAAQVPDLDTLWSIEGPIAAFQHHRGWTHTFLGLPFEAAILVPSRARDSCSVRFTRRQRQPPWTAGSREQPRAEEIAFELSPVRSPV